MLFILISPWMIDRSNRHVRRSLLDGPGEELFKILGSNDSVSCVFFVTNCVENRVQQTHRLLPLVLAVACEPVHRLHQEGIKLESMMLFFSPNLAIMGYKTPTNTVFLSQLLAINCLVLPNVQLNRRE